MNEHAPLMRFDCTMFLQIFRSITNATNERTMATCNVPAVGVGHNASIVDYRIGRTIASTLVLGNMNSLPFDWAARFAVGGVNMSLFIVKQLPILPPEIYLEEAWVGRTYAELIVKRVLELTYTGDELEGFARDLGYMGPPFSWDDRRRHCLKSELDAIYMHMYRFDRLDVEWILDSEPPGMSFPTLKRNEEGIFGEYRTRRYVLHAFDQIGRGERPCLADA